ncbi:MAG: RNA polymerase sigma factor [Anaerolineae bacterium]
METRQKSNEVLVERLLPAVNDNPKDRAVAWEEWYASVGVPSVMAFVRVTNDTVTPDDDIVHDAIATAYEQVEGGRYEPRLDIPFTAYVKGIARNKIREARRRSWRYVALDDARLALFESDRPSLESLIEHQERIAKLCDDITRLSPLQQRVLTGYFHGRSTGEIAQASGMSEEAVRQHKSRALRRIQRRARL